MHECLKQHFANGANGSDLLFYGARIPQAVVDRKGIFVEANAAFSAFFGYTPNEIIGRNFSDFTHPEDLKGDLAAVDDLLVRRNSLTHYEMDKRYLHKIGAREVWFHLIVDAIWLPDSTSPDAIFCHFYVVALPHPNGGRYVREEKAGRVTVRPSVNLIELIKDNKPFFIAFIIFACILHPKILELLIHLVK